MHELFYLLRFLVFSYECGMLKRVSNTPTRAHHPRNAPTMPLIYAFVARGPTVLAEHTSHSGNFATVAAEVSRETNVWKDVGGGGK